MRVNGNELERDSYPSIDMQYLRAGVIGSFVFSGSLVLSLPIVGLVVNHVIPYRFMHRVIFIYDVIFSTSLAGQDSSICWGISLVVSSIVTALVVRRVMVN